MTKLEIIEYEIWRKTLSMTLRNALAPSDLANMYSKAITINKSEALVALLLIEIDEFLPKLNPIKHSSIYKQLKVIYNC